MGIRNEYLQNIVYDFEHCGEDGDCEVCRANERLNGKDCTFCDLLLTYSCRNDISNALTKLIDKL